MDRKCLECGCDFTVASMYSNTKFCSSECRFKSILPKTFGDGCVSWPRSLNPQTGYGQFNPGSRPGKMISAHRMSYLVFNGEIPAGMVVRHVCDIRDCVNPRHLKLGTQSDNIMDMWERGRQQDYKSCPKGDKNPAKIYPEKLARGSRHGKSILNEAAVKAIRRSTDSHANLGRKYGVTPETIGAVRKRLTWKHVD